MNTFSKKQLNEKALPVFKEHPNAPVLYGTSDGQFFLNKNRADLHASANKFTVHDIEAPQPPKGEEAEMQDDGLTVKEIKELVDGTADKAQLEQLLEDERNGENRKTAIAAIEARLKELAAARELEVEISNEEPKNEEE